MNCFNFPDMWGFSREKDGTDCPRIKEWNEHGGKDLLKFNSIFRDGYQGCIDMMSMEEWLHWLATAECLAAAMITTGDFDTV